MFNFNNIKGLVKNTLNDIFSSSIVENVIYKRYDGSNFDPSLGSNITTYSEYSIDIIRGNNALQTKGMSTVLKAVGFTTGDRVYITRFEELPRNPNDQLILKDLIIDFGEEYEIKKVIPIYDLLVYIQV